MILGTGALFDSHPSARIIAEQYHAIACATFSLESIIGGATCASFQALFMMAHFLFLTDRSGNERRWLLNGLCIKVIHMVGRFSLTLLRCTDVLFSLQLGLRKEIRKLFRCISESHSRSERDSAGWNLNEEEIQRRRIIFWEYFNWECWTVSAMHCVELLFCKLRCYSASYMGAPLL
jgi:hypothetical protein